VLLPGLVVREVHQSVLEGARERDDHCPGVVLVHVLLDLGEPEKEEKKKMENAKRNKLNGNFGAYIFARFSTNFGKSMAQCVVRRSPNTKHNTDCIKSTQCLILSIAAS
jgi:hypothetical protein